VAFSNHTESLSKINMRLARNVIKKENGQNLIKGKGKL